MYHDHCRNGQLERMSRTEAQWKMVKCPIAPLVRQILTSPGHQRQTLMADSSLSTMSPMVLIGETGLEMWR